MDVEKENKRFFNGIARIYESFLIRRWSINVQKKTIAYLNIKKNSKILDAGCGTGNLLKILSKRNDLKLFGIDISEEMLKIAKEKLNEKAKLKLESVQEINFKNKFDYIFSVDAFHHYSEQEKVMKNFYISMKKNGKLIIADLDFGFLLNKFFHSIEPGNTKVLTKNEIKKLFYISGFENIKQKKIGLFSVLTIGKK